MRPGGGGSFGSCAAGRGRWERVTVGPTQLLFVSSTTTGGSGRSQRELALALQAEGCGVRFLVDPADPASVRRRVLEELTDATVRLTGARIRRPVEHARSLIGAGTRSRTIDGLVHETTIAPENAFETVVGNRRPHVVVVSSISRVSWRAIRAVCRRRGIPTVLYLREATAIGHLTAGLLPDRLVANSGSLVDVAARHGHRAALVPSVVNVAPMRRPPTGEVALLVNPIRTHGIETVGPMAAALPHIPIVLQESWSLADDQQAEVDRLVRTHANVTFRPFEPRPGMLFRDAGVLLAPHRLDNRPRTVLEAQANGLPVIAADQPGLVEAVGGGGVLVDRDAGPDAWVRALGDLWDDPRRRSTLGERARMHAARPEVRPERVAARFLDIVADLVSDRELVGAG